MQDTSEARGRSAVVIHPSDTVAVALRHIGSGSIHVQRGEEALVVSVVEPIPMGHKLALNAFSPGDPIVKYGEVIGVATTHISAGAHVHVHNLRSRRAGAAAAQEHNEQRST